MTQQEITKRDEKRALQLALKNQYEPVVPLAKGMISNAENEKQTLSLIATLHKSVLGLTKTGEMRPISDLRVFMAIANQYGLNPFKKEIYATYIWDSNRRGEELMPIVSIHGLRKLARKGGVYTHTGAAEVKKDGDKLLSVTVPVFGRWDNTSTPIEVTRYTAYYDEFVRTNREGQPMSNWKTMPIVMLTKCAEANALRAGFDIAGIYVEEELTANANNGEEGDDE